MIARPVLYRKATDARFTRSECQHQTMSSHVKTTDEFYMTSLKRTFALPTCATEVGRHHTAAVEVETIQVDESVNRIFYL